MKKVISIILLLTMSITAFNVFPVTAAAVTGKSGDWTAQAAETQEEIGAQEAPDTTGGSLVTVYFVNTYEWEDVYIYSWNPTTDQWPGRQMEFAGTVAATGEKVYKGQVDPSSAGFVFNNHNGKKTVDIKSGITRYAGWRATNNKDVCAVEPFTFYESVGDPDEPEIPDKPDPQSDDDNFSRGWWLHQLTETFDMKVKEENYPDNYFKDIKSTSKYYHDVMLAADFGVIDVKAGERVYPSDYVTREYAASTLNFCLGFKLDENAEYTFSDSSSLKNPDDAQVALNRGWFSLIDGEFRGDENVRLSEANNMLADAKAVLEQSIVDRDYNSTCTFENDVKVIPKGTECSLDGDTLTVAQLDTEIRDGDVFAVYLGAVPSLYTAESVTTGSDTVTIKVSDAGEVAVKSADIEGGEDWSSEYIEPAEGVELEFEYEDGSVSSSPKSDDSVGAQGKQKLKNIKAEKKFKIGDASVTLKCTINKLTVDYIVKSDHCLVTVSGDANLSASVKLDDLLHALGGESSITLMGYNVPGVGKIGVSVFVSISGSLTLNYNGSFTSGVEYTKTGGFRLINFFQKCATNICSNVTSDIGIKLSAELNIVDKLKGALYAKAGLLSKIDSITYDDNLAPRTCRTFCSYLYAMVGCSLKVFSKSWSSDKYFYNEDNSPIRVYYHYEDGRLVGKCARSGIDYTTRSRSRYGSPYGSSYGFGDDWEPITIFNYKLDKDDNAVITKYYGNVSSVAIPNELDGHKVVGIDVEAFRNQSLLSTISVPNTVTRIEKGAFLDCSSLAVIELSDNVTFMGGYALGNCDSLESITLPKSLTNTSKEYYSKYMYDYQWGVFIASDNLRHVTFAEGTKKIASGVLGNCKLIKEITIPESVTEIGDNAFYNNPNLTSVHFNNNLITIGTNAFMKTGITEAHIPNTVTVIKAGAFAGCQNLSDVTLSDHLEKLYGYAFADCDALTSITIPKSVKETSKEYYYEYIYDYQWGVFQKSDNLTEVRFEDGITFIPQGICANNDSIKSVIIPDTVTEIRASSFYKCSALSDVKLPKALSDIGSMAFGFTALQKLEVPDSVVTIKDGAFLGCKKLTEVKLSKNLKGVYGYAFGDCDSLTTITIPKSVSYTTKEYYYNYIYDYQWGVFIACDELKEVVFEDGIKAIPAGFCANNSSIETVKIPESVTSIGEFAFYKCKKLKETYFPKSLEKLGKSAYSGCSEIKEVIVPDTVTEMGESEFSNCISLEKAKLSNQVTSIPNSTFAGCIALKEAVVPDVVTYIGNDSFNNCASLETFKYPSALKTIGNKAYMDCKSLKKAELPEGLTSIGTEAFRNCEGLQEVLIPISVSEIKKSTFENCSSLTTVKFEDYSVKTLGETCFKDCSSLQKITLPKGLVKIDKNAFEKNISLTEAEIPESVTTINDMVFSYPDKLTVYGCSESYAKKYCDEKEIKFVDNHVFAKGISLDQSLCETEDHVVLIQNETKRMKFEVYPLQSNDVITLSCSNGNVTVDGMKITGKKVGDCTITAKTSGGVEYTFSAYVKSVKSITIDSMPDKTVYTMGEDFDQKGMKIKTNYNDGTSEPNENFTVSGYSKDKIGIQKLTVTGYCKDGKTRTVTFEVEVLDARGKQIGISIKNPPDKLRYLKYDDLDLGGLIVTEDFDSGIHTEITDYTVSGYNALKLGKQTITVKKGEYSATFEIEVVESLDPPAPQALLGDVDGDGSITITDATTIQRYIAEYELPNPDIIQKCGDVDGDGSITVTDATTIQKYIAEYELPYPIGEPVA